MQCTIAIAVLCLISAPGVAVGASDPARAQAAGKCADVATTNGGLATTIFASKVSCTLARKVARRARGAKTYKSSSFTCKYNAKTYSCFRPGTSKGIGFKYERRAS